MYNYFPNPHFECRTSDAFINPINLLYLPYPLQSREPQRQRSKQRIQQYNNLHKHNIQQHLYLNNQQRQRRRQRVDEYQQARQTQASDCRSERSEDLDDDE